MLNETLLMGTNYPKAHTIRPLIIKVKTERKNIFIKRKRFTKLCGSFHKHEMRFFH
jgi:hypothetical protein